MTDSGEKNSDYKRSRKGDYKKAYAIKNLQLRKRLKSSKEAWCWL